VRSYGSATCSTFGRRIDRERDVILSGSGLGDGHPPAEIGGSDLSKRAYKLNLKGSNSYAVTKGNPGM